MIVTAGVSLCKRLKHAGEVRHKAKDELSRLIESSNGIMIVDMKIRSFDDTTHACVMYVGTLTDTVVQELEEKQLAILSRSPSKHKCDLQYYVALHLYYHYYLYYHVTP